MATTLYRPQPREKPPQLPSGELSLQEPPALPEVQAKDPVMMFTMIPMMLMSGVMMLVFMGQRNPTLAAFMFLGIIALVGLLILFQISRAGLERRRTLRSERRDYLRYLGQVRVQVQDAARRQRASLMWRHPAPSGLWNLALTTRLWERRAAHGDFAEARIGLGPHKLSMRISPLSTKPIADLEPLTARALRRFIAVHGTVPDLPVSLFLRGLHTLRLRGDRETSVAMTRAMLAQLVALHMPDELKVAVCATPDHAEEWDWLKWLPHAQHESMLDGAGTARMFDDQIDSFTALIDDQLGSRPRFEAGTAPSSDEPFVVIVVDSLSLVAGTRLADASYRGAVIIEIDAEADETIPTGGVLLDVDPARVDLVNVDRAGKVDRSFLCAPDRMTLLEAATLARVVSPYRVGGSVIDTAEPMLTDFELPELLGVPDIDTWTPSSLQRVDFDPHRLRIPIGVDERGRPVELDLKEAAQGGMGPHGLLIGATGSGKSELLRTLVLGLAMSHSSEILNFVLVDFKGGATFLGLDELPHVSALITNLADEATLVTRMQDAIAGELNRRQEYLRTAGNYASLLEHERARLAGAPLDPMPSLVIVVDEFSELLTSNPDFGELFVMIGRLGRSLGVHLLLASQRLDGQGMNKLESHLSYRIGLRTFSAMESRTVIGVPDAYQLPNAPGHGYLRSDVATLTRFKAAYVSGAHRRRTAEERQAELRQQVVTFRAARVELENVPQDEVALSLPQIPDTPEALFETSADTESSVLALAIERLEGIGPPARQVWLPPLSDPPTLDLLLPPLLEDPARGLHAIGWTGTGRLGVPIGVVDRPYDQTRELYQLDLHGSGGNVGVAGGAQSGKTTVIRTLVSSLALTNPPTDVQFFCLDFGGGGLATLSDLPHVGSVATRLQPERISRTIAEVHGLIRHREQFFADHGLEGMADYRAKRAAGAFASEPFGDLFLVVDGWGALRSEFEEHDMAIRAIARQGLAYGVHVVIGTNRWTDVHSSLRDQIGTRIELRLGDPIDSIHGMRKAAAVPDLPGRGITNTGHHFLTAVPRIDGVTSAEQLGDASRELAAALDDAWSGPVSPEVRLLPAVLDADTLPAPEPGPRIALGNGEHDLQPVWHDFGERPNLSIVGDTGSGKTGALRLLAQAIPALYTPKQACIIAIDSRRTMLESLPEEYVVGTAFNTSAAAELIDRIAGELLARVPGPEITPAQLRRRDWWTGAEVFVLVDDYDLMLGNGQGPLSPLVELIPQAGDIGLHLVVARAGAGSGRTSMDSVIRRLHEANAPELTLSMPPTEIMTFGTGKGRLLPPGRGAMMTRRGGVALQLGWTEPPR